MSTSERMGFIKLHRSLVDWEWYHDDRCVRLFIHILLSARYLPGRWQGMDIMPGDLPTSTVKLANELGWSRSAVNRTLDKLRSTNEVDTKADSKWTVVTVVNWAKWQGDDEMSDTKPTNNRTTTGQQPDTLKEGKKERRKEEIHTRKSLFANCPFADVETAKAQLPELVEAGIDLAAYRDAIRNWSDTKNELRTERGWLATYRQWVKRDEERGTVKRIVAVTEKQRPVWNML